MFAPYRVRRKATISVICLVILLAPVFCYPQEAPVKSWDNYYPLANGNSWTYSATGKPGGKSVVWKVLNVKAAPSGQVFAVWPTWSVSDDSGMNLQLTPEGLRELNDDFFVLRFPLSKGRTWSVSRHNKERVFVVIREGEQCAVGQLKFDTCAVVRDDDQDAKLRTVTTYALGVGPVRYEYYKMVGGSFASETTQVLNLVSYGVNPSVLDPKAKHR
jgi:hypothetical protein